jgi:hypothetical protein
MDKKDFQGTASGINGWMHIWIWAEIVLVSTALIVVVLVPDARLSILPLVVIGTLIAIFLRCEAFMRRSRNTLVIAADAAVRAGAADGDMNSVALLLRSLDDNEMQVRTAARDALVEILPRLGPTDSHLLTTEHRHLLLRILSSDVPSWDHVLLYISILKALEKVGPEPFIGIVERLAQGRGAGLEPSIEVAALECLPKLRKLVERQNAESELLRGATSPAEGHGGTLLRPAAAAPSSASDDLVRPTVDAPDGSNTAAKVPN